MPLAFTKMHGLGNDYVYINTFDQVVDDPPVLARAVSDRHRGIGSDGLILIAPPEDSAAAEVRMIMFNADGTRSQMCGNGIRCVGKYAYEHGLARRNPLRVATDRGVLTLELTVNAAGQVTLVRVDMGEPILEPRLIPLAMDGDRAVNVALCRSPEHAARGRQRLPAAFAALPDVPAGAAEFRGLRFTAVSMGNPHAVFFVSDVERVPLRDWGPRIEYDAHFPERVNAHFVQVVRPDYARMITWERGTGPTQACGTGASAVCVAGVLNGVTGRKMTAMLPGGELMLEWDERTNHVFKTGPATEVFGGTWET